MAMRDGGVRSILLGAGLMGVLCVGLFSARNASSAGVPLRAVNYSGFLERNGAPVTGPTTIGLELFADASTAAPLCTVPAESRLVQAGVFDIPLGECTDVFASTPDVFVGLVVEGTAMPRNRVGSVPYAQEAAMAQQAASVATVSTQCAVRSMLRFDGQRWVCGSARAITSDFSDRFFGIPTTIIHRFAAPPGNYVLNGYLLLDGANFSSTATCHITSEGGGETVTFYGSNEYARRIPVAGDIEVRSSGEVRVQCGFPSFVPPPEGTMVRMGGRLVLNSVGAL